VAWVRAGGEFAACHQPVSFINHDVFIVNTYNAQMTGKHLPRGRPPRRIQDRPFQMRVSEQFLQTVDDWRRGQIDLPSRAEAIRRMVELAAKMKRKPEPNF
jgi:hypothetical protein